MVHFGKLLKSLDLSEFRVNWLGRHCGTTAGHVPQGFPHVESCQRADSGTAIRPFVLYHGCQGLASMQQIVASILCLDRHCRSEANRNIADLAQFPGVHFAANLLLNLKNNQAKKHRARPAANPIRTRTVPTIEEAPKCRAETCHCPFRLTQTSVT